MPPVIHNAKDEADFMQNLLVGLDDSSSLPPHPQTPQKLPKRQLSSRPQIRPTVPSPSKVFSAGEIDVTAFLEGAEDWNWEDISSGFPSPKKQSPRKSTETKAKAPEITPYIPEPCTRCTVESITESDQNGCYQKNLVVRCDQTEERRSVILLDDWTATDIRTGDIINILGNFTPVTPSSSSNTLSITISSKSNLLILHPDILLTATALANAPHCRRTPLLQNLVRSSNETTPALVWGNMLHEVMQACLSAGRWEQSWINERIDQVILKGLNELIKINVNVEQAKRELVSRSQGLAEFSAKYISNTPKPGAILTNTRATFNQAPSLLAISELLDVEEDILSPTYGLKGKLDATVHAIISDPSPLSSQPILTGGPMPFEIKTGRATAVMEHRAQTMLYTLLAAERYGVQVPAGLLYYTQSAEVVRVPASRNELRGLFIARNEMAGYMMRRTQKSDHKQADIEDGFIPEPFLPPTIDDERSCKRCYVLDTCMLYRKAVENVVDTTSPIADTYELKTGHLSPTHMAFFKQWEALISLEEQDLVRFKKELWTMGAAEREAKGRCFSSMTLDESFRPPAAKPVIAGDSRIHRFTYRFVRSYGATSLLNGHLNSGEPITVSIEPGLLALARGFILELTPKEVIIGVDHELNLQNIITRLATLQQIPISSVPTQVIFRIDKDELFSGMGRIRDNLAQLFYAEGDKRRLELVVDLKSPTFNNDSTTMTLSTSTQLNPNQQLAMCKVLSARDYALILGMPGTGKTTIIAEIIRALVALGKTILLTSYTHSAVDNILSKLDDTDFGILRLGNLDKIHPDVHKYTLANKGVASTVEQLQDQLMSPPVVATTCLSIDHALFSRRKFDFCIVDEASQITLPTCLGPLRFADTFVLVGDHFQLPPLVRNKAARKGGLDVSLFRRLSDAHPHAVVDLTHQYRMNEDIMVLSNKLIYGDRLKCGSAKIAHQTLVLPDRTFLHSLHSGISPCHPDGCWVEKLMAESCKAVFVDTDNLPARDSHVGDLVQNEIEGDIIRQIVETLLGSGVQEDQLGIISLYRQQVKLLSHLLQGRKNIEILTADRSQGRDKDCIIISMVRSNDTGNIGDLIKDWRRMNVSFTRARTKLIIIGSRKTLQAADLLAQFFGLMDSHGWILKLPHNAHKLHVSLMECETRISPKRVASCMDGTDRKENLVPEKPSKKIKVKSATTNSGLLKGRPILKDLIGDNVAH